MPMVNILVLVYLGGVVLSFGVSILYLRYAVRTKIPDVEWGDLPYMLVLSFFWPLVLVAMAALGLIDITKRKSS